MARGAGIGAAALAALLAGCYQVGTLADRADGGAAGKAEDDCAGACAAEASCAEGDWWWDWDGCMEGCGGLPDGAVACVQAVCVMGLAEGEVACDGWVDCIAHCASEEES